MARKTKSKSARAKTKEVKAKKTEKPQRAEKGERYYCDVCGCEVAY